MINITYWEKFVPIREKLKALSSVRYDWKWKYKMEAKEFLGIENNKETRLDASEKGKILEGEADRIFLNISGSSSDQRDRYHHMQRKIQKAVELVRNSDFEPIPEPKWDT
jgi:hypothetical protein